MEVLNSSQRYSRQIAVSEIGTEGQVKISSGKVFIVGCGALGSMIAMQLAGAGVGTLGIADFDNIEISNLQRQFFFQTQEAGKSKSQVMGERIKALNPDVKIEIYNSLITEKKANEIFPDYDFIIDATDNPDSKRMIDKVALKFNKPCCLGGIRDFSGQIITLMPQDLRFEDYFGTALQECFLPCSKAGVIGPAAAFCASLMANEAIKFLTGVGELLSNKLLTFDLFHNNFRIFSI